jgi:hypothetical protein
LFLLSSHFSCVPSFSGAATTHRPTPCMQISHYLPQNPDRTHILPPYNSVSTWSMVYSKRGGHWECLTGDNIDHIIEHLDITSTIRLAICNKDLCKRIGYNKVTRF